MTLVLLEPLEMDVLFQAMAIDRYSKIRLRMGACFSSC